MPMHPDSPDAASRDEFKPANAPGSKALVLTALLIIQLLFGINYVVSKIVLGSFPPLVWASIRITVSAAVMIVFALSTGRRHPRADRAFFVPMILFALLGTVINQTCFLVGLSHTTSTNSAILNTLIPVFTLLFVTLGGYEPSTPKKILGFISAFAGVLVIRKVENFSLSDKTLLGDSLTIINCLSYSLFLTVSKKFLERYDAVWATVWLFVYGSIGISILALPEWMSFHWPAMSASLAAACAFAILGATLVTYFLNFWTLGQAKSSNVALFIYLQPVVAATIAWIWLGETVTLRTALASLLIFMGMVLGLSGRVQAQRGQKP